MPSCTLQTFAFLMHFTKVRCTLRFAHSSARLSGDRQITWKPKTWVVPLAISFAFIAANSLVLGLLEFALFVHGMDLVLLWVMYVPFAEELFKLICALKLPQAAFRIVVSFGLLEALLKIIQNDSTPNTSLAIFMVAWIALVFIFHLGTAYAYQMVAERKQSPVFTFVSMALLHSIANLMVEFHFGNIATTGISLVMALAPFGWLLLVRSPFAGRKAAN